MADIGKDGANAAPGAIFLKDYTPPAYLVDTAELDFELDAETTTVRSRLSMHRNPVVPHDAAPLVLDGQDLELVSLTLDGRGLEANEYKVGEESLTIENVPERFTLEVETRIHPAANTALEGLYASGGMLCTQCEAEGFRRITYYPDRPDVMAVFTVTLLADRERYPVLLSNGNPFESQVLDDGRQRVRWHDPYPKPSYLFALVGGQLDYHEDRYTTCGGREVTLRIYVEPRNLGKCEHAMACLKQAMRWDEETYGREYDLDVFNIVAVDDFNMGAMENKGLNVFNAACVLASPETATDDDYYNIQGIVGHEYFHNWSGNRVTCRDWFQLSLKEGFTVFRDQEFSADMNSAAVKRIGEVNILRTHQFAQDAGPMAHPVRPDSYIEISNFYTVTVYNKGAEVVRMVRNLLGAEGFRRGTDLYFERHDGQAVTTDDFIRAMEDANEVDLTQFKLWYDQAGTPELRVRAEHDPKTGTYTLHVRQSCPATPGQPDKAPFHIPLAVGLLDAEGRELPLRLAGESAPVSGTRMLEVREAEQRFSFVDIADPPVASLLRGFSAPVKVLMDRSDAELAFLLAHDSDEFNRWDAGQQLAIHTLLRLIPAWQAGESLALDDSFVDAFGRVLADRSADPALVAQALTLPSEAYLADQCEVVDVAAIHAVRQFARERLAEALREQWEATYAALADDGPYRFTAEGMARRWLKNLALGYLMELDEDAGDIQARCLDQFESANNMTDALGALGTLVHHDIPARERALNAFYDRWQDDPQVVDKWFALQAGSRLPDTLARVKALMNHPAFKLTNPNKVRALIGRFCQGNPVRFHAADGSGYAFLADQVLALDGLNPQIAARLLGAMSRWRRYDEARGALMRAQLERVRSHPGISKDVYEIAAKSLDQ
ncbi:MAG: aminopeptidase N [Gammaproteobacteria bacterium]